MQSQSEKRSQARWSVCNAVDLFGASHAGAAFAWNWADFPTRGGAETFALACAVSGWGVYFSRLHADRNRVMFNPDWQPEA